MNARVMRWLESAWEAPPGQAPSGTWLLELASRIYAWGAARHRPAAVRAPIPVVSVGSIWSGGAGKTPLTAELARIAAAAGLRPAIVMRGYRGRIRSGAEAVGLPLPEGAALHFGDEACLHARRGTARVYVAPRRLTGARAAAGDGCRLVLLDDGMQHRQLARQLEIVTLPAVRPLANGGLLPRGPLREGPDALVRAGLIVLAHAGRPAEREEATALVRRHNAEAPVLAWRARTAIRPLTGLAPAPGARVALLSGIARPRAFRGTVQGEGFVVAREFIFADHHVFSQEEVSAAAAAAAAAGVRHLLVTEKDEMRLPGIDLGNAVAFAVADLRLEWITAGAEEILRDRLCSLG
jgi:tetraacyldisaccharide 4'-kinase